MPHGFRPVSPDAPVIDRREETEGERHLVLGDDVDEVDEEEEG